MDSGAELKELNGLRVLVTRPAGQADGLCNMIAERGGVALRLPAIEIEVIKDNPELVKRINRLEDFDLAVFVSANAVHRGFEFILAQRDWPSQVKIAAVGPTSTEAVTEYGQQVDYVPVHEYSSEGLLALPELQELSGQRVIIFRGNGGRSKLYDELSARGAAVEYAEVYQRNCPTVDPAALLPYWQPGALDVITVASNETLENLFKMAGPQGQPLLRELQLVVPGQRQVTCARKLGFSQAPVVAANAGDEAIVVALKKIASHKDANKKLKMSATENTGKNSI